MIPYICPTCRRVLVQPKGYKNLKCEKCTDEQKHPINYTKEYIEGYWNGYFTAKEELRLK